MDRLKRQLSREPVLLIGLAVAVIQAALLEAVNLGLVGPWGSVALAGISVLGAVFARGFVTPVADPVNRAGVPLEPVLHDNPPEV